MYNMNSRRKEEGIGHKNIFEEIMSKSFPNEPKISTYISKKSSKLHTGKIQRKAKLIVKLL